MVEIYLIFTFTYLFIFPLNLFSSIQNLLPALVALGLNILEQEVIDMTNTIARNGLIFFPEFCNIALKKFREDDESEFAQIMFKVGLPPPHKEILQTLV